MAPKVLSGLPNAVFNSPYAACNMSSDGRWISGEGSTALDSALGVVIQYFKQYGSKKVKTRALLLVRDAAVDRLPVAEFQELKEQNIRPYMIFIKPNRAGLEWLSKDEPNNSLLRYQIENSEKMIQEFLRYGWRYYEVSDKNGLEQVYAEIDRLESVGLKQKVIFSNENLAYLPLLIAFYSGTVVILLGIGYEFLWGNL